MPARPAPERSPRRPARRATPTTPAPDAAPNAPLGQPATLSVAVERITFQSADTGYTVARGALPSGGLVTVVGDLAGVVPGESLEIDGSWQVHASHGPQFHVTSFRSILPATVEGLRRFLGSGLIAGVGPVVASRIVDRFGVETLNVIESAPSRLAEIPGIGPRKAGRIAAAWAEQRGIRDVMSLLGGLGINPAVAVRIYRQFGSESERVVREQPYRLAREVWGVGFRTADQVARGLGLPLDSPERGEAGLLYTLGQSAEEQGHCYLPRRMLIGLAAEMLECPADPLGAALDRLASSEDVVVEPAAKGDSGEDQVYLVPFHRAEVGIAGRLRRLLDSPASRMSSFASVNWDVVFHWLDGRQRLNLAPEQAAAVRLALTSKVAVLTGGPGTGKSTTVRSIVEIARAKGREVTLAAPTGRAAKRLSDLAGLPARTIHRLLGLRMDGTAARNDESPIEADLVVVDECSMLDLFLLNSLLRAIPPDAHLLLVGDPDQLPSVGAGNVLHDLLASEALPTVRLATVFRQAETSAIVMNAHRINAGETPTWGPPIADFFYFAADRPETAADLVVDLVLDRITRKFSIPSDEIQVLTPVNRGPAGVETLNARLQDALNPARAGLPEARLGERTLRVGDRVIALRNDYTLEVFNGDLGVVGAIDPVERVVRVALEDGRRVDFPFAQADELSHAWALTVHKAQGSEFRAVVVVLHVSQGPLLARNLLYTAVTRARELVVLVGQREAIGRAVRTQRVSLRFSALAERLRRTLRAVSPV